MPFTFKDLEDPFTLDTSVAQIKGYLDGTEINEAIDNFDDVLDEAQGAAKISGTTQFIVITVKP